MASKLRILVKAHTVARALGWLDGLQELTGAGRNSIHNWIAFEQFPARYYKCMSDALAARGYYAPPSLWGQRDKRDATADAA